MKTVTSVDGTSIAYRDVGEGPCVVLVHGAMQTAHSFSKLANALSTSFRVIVPHRRGRGGSGAHGDAYGLKTEVDDLDAILRATRARFVFGLSSGALVALSAARTLGAIDKLAVYEPPFTVDGADPAAWAPRYERDIARGDLAAAMVTALQGTGDVDWLTYTPRMILVPLVRIALRADAKRASADHVPMIALVPTIRYDVQLQREATSMMSAFSEIRCDVLLMNGRRSHRALRGCTDAFARMMPNAKRVSLPRVGHVAADDVGRPLLVADRLRDFFTS